MPTDPKVGFKGLKTSGNPLSHPPGSLSHADNCVILERDVIQVRRGHPRGENTFGDSSDRARTLTEYEGGLVVHYGPSGSGGDTLALATTPTGTWANLAGTWAAPDETVQRMKFAQLADNLYWTSSAAPGVLDGLGGAARQAGVAAPVSRDVGPTTTPLSGNPGAGWLATDSAVAYRLVVGRKDLNNNIKLSAPSGRVVVINPADVTVAIGSLARAGGTTVTATVTSHRFRVGDIVALSPGEANFTAGNYTVTATTSTTIVWNSVGIDTTNGVQQTISSGTKNTGIVAIIPNGVGIVAGDFLQLYRTLTSAGQDSEPGDDCFLAYERTLTASDISSRSAGIADTTPESFLGANLYTNSNGGQGSQAGYLKPPLMDDMCVFDGRLFGFQTQMPQELTLRLIGIGSPYGLQAGDLLAIGNRVYVADTDFQLCDDFLPSQNIDITAQAISGMLSSADYAAAATDNSGYFVSQVTATQSLPVGGIVIQRRSITDAVFYAATSRASAWQDALPAITAVDEASSSRTGSTVTITTATAHGLSSGVSVVLAISGTTADANFPVGVKGPITVTGASTFTYAEAGAAASIASGTYFVFATTYASKRNEKRVRFSEPGQPEAWPVLNFLGGLPERRVLRGKALRGQLYVFFDDGDIYTVSGSYPYTTSKFNGSASLVAPDTLQEHAESLYCLTTQGIAVINESGLRVASRDIETQLRTAMITSPAIVAAYSFGIGYEWDRQYQLWLGNSEYVAGQAYVFQSDSGQFTKWPSQSRTCGLSLRADNGELLVFGASGGNWLRFESKTYTDHVDFFDDVYTLGSGTDIESTGVGQLTASTPGLFDDVSVGDRIRVNFGAFPTGWVTDISGDVLTFDSAFVDLGEVFDIDVMTAIKPVRVGWLAAASGAPGLEKQFRELQLHFGQQALEQISVSVTGERQATPQTVTLEPGTWSDSLTADALSTLRVAWPSDAMRQSMVQVLMSLATLAGQRFRLLGSSLTYDGATEKTPKGGPT